jgi:2-C-methyl-D-erythritol 2,4-cyclodiphosphate synthase
MFRIGQGYDVHRLAEGETLWLGGILIPHHKGTVAHSDGDVLIHAICDALLGAAGLGDIGTHFPDSSEEFKNIDSKILLKKSCHLIRKKGFEPVNVDATICLQQPRLSPFIPEMKRVLAREMELEENQVSVKATTTERLGFEGREEGISALAIVLVEKRKSDGKQE